MKEDALVILISVGLSVAFSALVTYLMIQSAAKSFVLAISAGAADGVKKAKKKIDEMTERLGGSGLSEIHYVSRTTTTETTTTPKNPRQEVHSCHDERCPAFQQHKCHNGDCC